MFYTSLVRPILFALSEGDAEEAHLLAKRAIKRVQKVPPLLALIGLLCEANNNPHPVKICDITFPNRVGLAAGFDKDAEMILFLQELGFGFVEIGSVLPHLQKGNERPRMFRLPEHNAIINRMGFNSAGDNTVEANLLEARRNIRIPLGISLGKMKATSLEDAVDDYSIVLSNLYVYGNYFAINISSPNTPDLRKLQNREYLFDLVRLLVEQSRKMGEKPLFVKIAPDLTDEEVEETVGAAVDGGISGFIVSNTTVGRDMFGGNPPAVAKEIGGLSGAPLFELAKKKVLRVRKLAPNHPLFAVGGIGNIDRGRYMLNDAGADAIQIYSGFIYEGPKLIQDLRSI